MTYDVLIVGSGIAGSSLALALKKAGVSVCVVERDTHPRFAIGESTVPSTTLGYDYLARAYGIPEFHQMSHYLGLKELGLTGWPKQHFYFAHHTEGRPLQQHEELMYETLELPLGPDVHVLRADTDTFLVSRFPTYGVDYLDRTEVVDFGRDGAGVYLEVKGPGGQRRLDGRLVVDASGHASWFAKKLSLRDAEPRLKTTTRSIFGHFENVPSLEDVVGAPNPAFRFKRHGGTQHHCFEGGWVWVIPFDDGVTSVGLQLDPRIWPLDERVPPEEELRRIFAKFPTVQAHLGGMRPVRKLVRTGRVQFTSKTILGDGFVLTPHAAGFIDPLFSTGITLTQSFVARFVPAVVKALEHGGHIDTEVFRPIEQAFMREVETIDGIVSGVMRSWGDYDTFKQMWRVWGYATIVQYTARIVGDHTNASGCTLMFGAAIDRWRETVQRMNEAVFSEPRGPALAAKLKAMLDEWPHPHNRANYELGSARSCSVAIEDPPHYFRWLKWFVNENPAVKADRSIFRLIGWGARLLLRLLEVKLRYRRGVGDDYSRAVDTIRALRVPRDDAALAPAPRSPAALPATSQP
ncbi:MAG: FAD-dependent oxidoreductase [Myxococcaceae bacterium]|nr:FAD-dependent oxidoreductase [Myxococcaceae bacterium]